MTLANNFHWRMVMLWLSILLNDKMMEKLQMGKNHPFSFQVINKMPLSMRFSRRTHIFEWKRKYSFGIYKHGDRLHGIYHHEKRPISLLTDLFKKMVLMYTLAKNSQQLFRLCCYTLGYEMQCRKIMKISQ